MKNEKKPIARYLLNISFFMSLVMLFVISVSSPAFAVHNSSAELQPEWSPAYDQVDYSVNFCKISGDTINEVRVYKNYDGSIYYTNFSCNQKLGWELLYIGSYPACFYVANSSSPYYDPLNVNGECQNFTFTAHTPGPEYCDLAWRFETRDNQDYWQYLYDNTSVDDVAPNITKEIIGTQSGPCPPGAGEECWIRQDTQINITVTEKGVCGISGLDFCEITYTVDGGAPVQEIYKDLNGELSWNYIMNFSEDSLHVLNVTCYDIAGNNATDIEKFRVDDTPPATVKTYGDPHYPPGINAGAPYPHWITTKTPITLTAKDGGDICHIDNVTTYYRDFVVENIYCENEYKCEKEYFGPEPPFMLYKGPFYKEDESCHVIEYYSVDGLGNTENVRRQCVYVEDQAPTGTKVVGEPKKPCEPIGEEPYCDGMPQSESCYMYSENQCIDLQPITGCFWDGQTCLGTPQVPCQVLQEEGEKLGYPNKCSETPGCYWVKPPTYDCWWVRDHVTEINLSCADEGPHPVDNEDVCFRVSYDIEPWLTDEYCADVGGTMQGPGDYEWCCVSKKATIVFEEDSVHDLEYYCRDALGNKNQVDLEYFRVDSQPPIINKTVVGPQVGDCPPDSPGDKCYIMDGVTQIHINAYDNSTYENCTVGSVTCEWGYWFNSTWYGWYPYEKPIIFYKDSTHELHIQCMDALENMVHDNETFFVDSTPPTTTKTYGQPFVEDWYPKGCYITGGGGVQVECTGVGCIPCSWAHWINSSTPVYLNATDEKVGVNKTYWRNTLMKGEGQMYCEKEYYCKTYHPHDPEEDGWNEYKWPFYKPNESCHIIEYFSIDKLGNTEPVKWQCVFVDNTPPEVNKTIGEPKVVKKECKPLGGENEGIDLLSLEERKGDVLTNAFGAQSVEAMNDGPCANATQPTQCAYVNVTDIPPYAKATAASQGANLSIAPPECNKALILSSGNPLDTDTTISTDMGNPGCGNNPDGYSTYDCVILGNYTPDADGIVLAVSAEWPEYKGTTFTDWMQVFGVNASVNISINDWKNVPIIPYDPSNSGTQTLATVKQGSKVNLRVADSGDGIYDTAIIILPEACFQNISAQPFCGDGKVDKILGEECDDGNNVNGDGCSATCKIEECKDGTVVEKTYITNHTPINLTCKDVFPHPVDHVTLQYRYRVSDDCKTWGNWTDWIEDPKDPYLAEKIIYFPEDSCHELEYYCKDGLGNAVPIQSEIDIVDTQPPIINKTIIGPWYGNCTLEDLGMKVEEETCAEDVGEECYIPPEKRCYIDTATKILVDAYDPEPHPVNNVTCDWEYTVNGEPKKGNYDVVPPFYINFSEESKHYLFITCSDALGNEETDHEIFLVDKKPPVTTKNYEGPQYSNDVEWISNKTNITFSAYDPEPHPSGVNKTYYRISLVDDTYCNGTDYKKNDTLDCDDAPAPLYPPSFFDVFVALSPPKIPEESCHLIEYYSVDNVNKTEEIKRQCVFVDNTPPMPNKTIGKPAEMWDGKDAQFYNISGRCWKNGEGSIECWKVTTMTPITMRCTDPEPHPVDHEQIYFHVELDGKDKTEDYCDDIGGEYNATGDGFCLAGEEAPVKIYFGEDSEHNLQYYCMDALGNKGPVDEEKFKVEGTAFNIYLFEKWNLISVPFVLLNSSIENVFEDVADDVESVWAYNNGNWYVWTPGPAPDTLSDIYPGWGYWVLAMNDTNLILGGSLFSPIITPPSRTLPEGWSLIGPYGTEWQNYTEDPYCPYNAHPDGIYADYAYCALNSLVDIQGNPGWAGLWTYVNCGNKTPGLPWKGINACTDAPTKNKMVTGYGYWILKKPDAPNIYAPASVCKESKLCKYFTPS